MNHSRLLVCFAALALLACGSDKRTPSSNPQPDNPVFPGQTDFVTVETEYGYGYQGGAMSEDAAGAPSAATASNTKAPSGREGTVEEADIYRIDGNRLFYLNTYKGFVIYDLNDPANPQRVARLPIHGYPVEMFVTPTTVYALLRDALYVTQTADGLRFKRHNVSQLVSIDITDLANPRVLKTIDIVGELREGVSRKIDDTVYVVSYLPQSYYWPGYPYAGDRTEQAWVYSFNTSDPQNIQLVNKLQIFEGGSNTSWDTGTGRWFSGVAISATSNTLHVVENWNVYGYVPGSRYSCGSWMSLQESVVSIIDISDPSGAIRRHSRFSTYGALTDQFKQTYFFDDATGRGYYLGIFARREWSSVDCQGTSLVQNTIEAWDVTNGDAPVRVGQLSFGKPNETVRGSTFDPERKVSFAITARAIDPLYAISYADPANLKVVSEIDGLSGDMNVFRLISGNDFLIGIGTDNSSACTGFGDPTTGWSTNVAVSIIDVRALDAIRLVQRKCVTVKDAAWVWSEINWNLDQAHKMIGMHSDTRANVISVPVNYQSKVTEGDGSWWWWWRPQSAVGLMSWDLTKYDPAQDELHQNVLQNWGTVLHPYGAVKRSIVFTHQGATARRMMVNLSDTHVSVVDIDDLSAPTNRALVEVAPFHSRLYRFGNYLVDEVRVGAEYQWQPGASEFRVKPAAKGADEAPAIATFTVGHVQRVVQWNNLLAIFRPIPQASGSQWRDRETELVLFDLSDPTHPVRRGSVTTRLSLDSYFWFGCGVDAWGWWPGYGGNSLAVSSQGIAVLAYQYRDSGYDQSLLFFDLADPDAPVAHKQVLLSVEYDYRWYTPPTRQYFGLVSAGQDGVGVFATYRDRVGTVTSNGQTFGSYKHFAERWSLSGGGLQVETAVNTPGQLIRTWEKNGADLLLSTDNRYVQRQYAQSTMWVAEPRLHLLQRQGSVATLTGSLDLGEHALGDIVGDSDRLFVTLTRPWYYWYETTTTDTAVEQPSDELLTVDVSASTLVPKFSGAIGTYWSQLMGVSGNRLFVYLPGDGLLTVDVSDLSAPKGQHFARTLGWATHIAFGGNLAFVAAGNFGIYELDLTSPPTIPQL